MEAPSRNWCVLMADALCAAGRRDEVAPVAKAINRALMRNPAGHLACVLASRLRKQDLLDEASAALELLLAGPDVGLSHGLTRIETELELAGVRMALG